MVIDLTKRTTNYIKWQKNRNNFAISGFMAKNEKVEL
jgi:hypothetical protein